MRPTTKTKGVPRAGPSDPPQPAQDAPQIRRKPDEQRKEAVIKIRVTEEQKRTLTEAADREGLDVSAWLRRLGLREASASPGGGDPSANAPE
ncbi:plasmid mobilization protein [Sorangium sp. So ce1153]|uniref:plasmid mobilization protein n=1 Tax=Sorangium sp. So ce1153 TaxID=3133333 RepID=UPI003F60428E